MKKNQIGDGQILPVLNEIAKKTGSTPIEMTTKQNHIGDDSILPILESIRDSIDTGGGSSAGVMSSSVSELVDEIIITEENQPIIFDNLDAIRDGGYTFVIESTESTLPTTSLSIYLNDDKTMTNYTRSWSGAYSTGEVSVGNEDTSIFMDIRNGHSAYCIAEVSFSGKVLSTQYNSDNSLLDIGMCKKDILTNVTKIEIVGNKGVTIGTKISLYKRKTEVKHSLVKEVILDVDATSVVFDNLDAVADGGYVLNFETSILGQPTSYELFYNDDRTPANYKRVHFGTWRGADFAKGETDMSIFNDANVGCRAFGKVDISSSGISLADSISNDETYLTYNIYPKTLLTNVTKIEVNTSDAQAGTVIPAGTKISLYRKKHFVGNIGTYNPTKDDEQDGRLDVIEAEQITQNTRLTGVESENIEQDATLVSLQAQIDELKQRPVDSMGSMSVNQLVSEIVITDENQPIIFDNLDAIADGGYIMIMDMQYSPVQVNYSFYFNDDTTNTNYKKGWFGIDRDGTESRGQSDTSIIGQVENSSMFGEIKISPKGEVISNHLFSPLGAGYQSNISLKTPIDNVTKLELVAPEPTPIGSRIALYKRKTEVKPSLVQEITVDTATTSIVFDNLDAVADGGYDLILESGIGTVTSAIGMYFNDDILAENYSRINLQSSAGNDAPITTTSLSAIFGGFVENGMSYITSQISTKGFIKSAVVRGDKVNQENYVFKLQPLDNITKIELISSVENSIPAGTKVALYRRKHAIGSSVSGDEVYDPAKDNEQDIRLDIIEAEQVTQNSNITDLQARPITDVDKAYVDAADTNLQNQINAMPNFITMTQAEYDALLEKDANTFYSIIG